MPPRRRLDQELVRRKLASSRTDAQHAIAAGLVTVDGAPARKPSTLVHAGQQLVVAAAARRFVSRGGDKLAHGLGRFGVDPAGRRCLDAGVSTGGFTDCLLQAGADHVLAYDVGYGQVHERLRRDARVTIVERTNVRHLTPADVPPPPPGLLVADLSFIALATVLPVLREALAADAEAVVLVKPQFELDREDIGRGGVVRDPVAWRRALRRVADAALALGWRGFDATASPLTGPAGNVEFLAHLASGPRHSDLDAVLDRAVAEGLRVRADGGRVEGADAGEHEGTARSSP